MDIVANRKIFYGISLTLVIASIISLFVFGLPLGIDFRGGSLLEVAYTGERPAFSEIESVLEKTDIGVLRIQPTEEKGVILRMRDLTEDEHQAVLKALRERGEIEERRFESIGPVIGAELKTRAAIALVVALVAILLYIAWAFRKISYRLSSWKYGIVALIALSHDIIMPAGIFSLLGYWKGIEIDALFITALLTILGFSIHDTIVVFDRVRENLKRFQKMPFNDVVEKSIKETIARSVNTSLTTLFVLLTVFFLGGASVKYFALALSFGVFFGTYSSIFLASPMLVTWEEWKKR